MAISTSLVHFTLTLLQTIYSVQAGTAVHFETTALLPVFSFLERPAFGLEISATMTTSYIQELDLLLPSNF